MRSPVRSRLVWPSAMWHLALALDSTYKWESKLVAAAVAI